VQQRAGKDCTIATATVTGETYERIAAEFGIQLDPATHKPDAKALERGIDLLNTILPLLRLGWFVAPLVSREALTGTEVERGKPSSDDLKAVLPGRKAVIAGENALAWNGQTAIDCSGGRIVSLDDVVALLLAPDPPNGPTRPRRAPRKGERGNV
jgi:hypothetical protein